MQSETPQKDACKRLKLVLMHDRTQLSTEMIEKMRTELVEVINKYVEIDKEALELNLESESNTIALVANIPVLRSRAVRLIRFIPLNYHQPTTSGSTHQVASGFFVKF